MNRFAFLTSHRYFIHGVVAIALFISFAFYRIYVWSNTQSTDNAYIEADISNVSAEVNGVIAEIFVQENTKVKKGQVIARIHDTDYTVAYHKALSALEESRRAIEVIQQNIKLARIDEIKAAEALEFAETNMKLVEVDYERTQTLSKDKFASRQKLDNAEINLEKARTDFAQSKLNMQMSQEKLNLLEIQRLGAIAKEEIARQELVLAQRALDNTSIRSPIDGTLGNSSLKIGNYVRAGVVLFAVVPEKLYVKANFKETQIGKFTSGMKVAMTFDAAPGYEVVGYIRNFSPATGSKFSLLPPANATGNFTKIVQRVPVSIDFNIPEQLVDKLTPGMSTIVSVRIDQKL